MKHDSIDGPTRALLETYQRLLDENVLEQLRDILRPDNFQTLEDAIAAFEPSAGRLDSIAVRVGSSAPNVLQALHAYGEITWEIFYTASVAYSYVEAATSDKPRPQQDYQTRIGNIGRLVQARGDALIAYDTKEIELLAKVGEGWLHVALLAQLLTKQATTAQVEEAKPILQAAYNSLEDGLLHLQEAGKLVRQGLEGGLIAGQQLATIIEISSCFAQNFGDLAQTLTGYKQLADEKAQEKG